MTLHTWDRETEKRIPACDCEDGNSRAIKHCEKCRIEKITILTSRGTAINEWRSPDGKKIYSAEPRCIGKVPEEVKAS